MSLAVIALVFSGAAQAATYRYVGNPMSDYVHDMNDAGHLEIVAELNCTAPCAQGSYIQLTQGVQSLTFSVFNADNTLRYTLSSGDPRFGGGLVVA